MNLAATRRFVNSSSTKLATTYLVIIMILSIGFSIVIYNTSAQQLRRQVPPESFYNSQNQEGRLPMGPRPINSFLEQRAAEGRAELRDRLIVLNGLALVLGSGVSWWLARRNLRPIEAAMEAQSQFVSDASHELRTPLAAILASNEVALRAKTISNKQARDILEHNVADVTKLQDLANNLLDLAQQDKAALTFQAVNLQDIATDAINQVIVKALEKNIIIEDQVPALQLNANRVALTRVVVILLDNALKYSPADTNILLKAEAINRNIAITVTDQGQGIAVSDIPHVFDRFYRSDQARSDSHKDGYGLGLAIAKSIVDRHNGTISVTSQINKGSQFMVKLPTNLA